MKFVKLKSKTGELRHLPKANTYIVYLSGDRTIDITDEYEPWWLDPVDATV